jgi:hypothetical protein
VPFARHLAATSAGLTYANIAIRGKLVTQAIDEQGRWRSRPSSGDGIEPWRPDLLPL